MQSSSSLDCLHIKCCRNRVSIHSSPETQSKTLRKAKIREYTQLPIFTFNQIFRDALSEEKGDYIWISEVHVLVRTDASKSDIHINVISGFTEVK